jgi:hypothetical protein
MSAYDPKQTFVAFGRLWFEKLFSQCTLNRLDLRQALGRRSR